MACTTPVQLEKGWLPRAMNTTRPGERPMTLRLVLVSLVAALGLTIPGVPMIESWVASTQNWMNARFADWDTRNPETPDYVIVSDYYDAERLAPHQQRTLPFLATTPREPPSRITPASSPPIRRISGPAETPATVSAHLTQVRPASFVRSLDLFKPIEVGDSLSLGFADELNRRSDGLHATTVTGTPGSQPRTPARNEPDGIQVSRVA